MTTYTDTFRDVYYATYGVPVAEPSAQTGAVSPLPPYRRRDEPASPKRKRHRRSGSTTVTLTASGAFTKRTATATSAPILVVSEGVGRASTGASTRCHLDGDATATATGSEVRYLIEFDPETVEHRTDIRGTALWRSVIENDDLRILALIDQ